MGMAVAKIGIKQSINILEWFLILNWALKSHVNEAIWKPGGGNGLMRQLLRYAWRDVIDQIWKLYVHPHLDYGDI